MCQFIVFDQIVYAYINIFIIAYYICYSSSKPIY